MCNIYKRTWQQGNKRIRKKIIEERMTSYNIKQLHKTWYLSIFTAKCSNWLAYHKSVNCVIICPCCPVIGQLVTFHHMETLLECNRDQIWLWLHPNNVIVRWKVCWDVIFFLWSKSEEYKMHTPGCTLGLINTAEAYFQFSHAPYSISATFYQVWRLKYLGHLQCFTVGY